MGRPLRASMQAPIDTSGNGSDMVIAGVMEAITAQHQEVQPEFQSLQGGVGQFLAALLHRGEETTGSRDVRSGNKRQRADAPVRTT
jgi:hypothetical protein